MKKLLSLILLFSLFSVVTISTTNVQLGDQGDNAIYNLNGSLIQSANLNVTILDSTGTTILWTEEFTNAIVNGSWNLMLGNASGNPLPLDYMKLYRKQYDINGESLSFTDTYGNIVNSSHFFSPLGQIQPSEINLTSIQQWDKTGTTLKPNTTGDTLIIGDGTTSAPGYSYENEPGLGTRRTGTNLLGFTVLGSDRMTLSASILTISNFIQQTIGGSALSPVITRSTDTNTGIYYPNLDKWAVTTGGVQRLLIDNSWTNSSNPVGITGVVQPSGGVRLLDFVPINFNTAGTSTMSWSGSNNRLEITTPLFVNNTQQVCTSENGLCNQTISSNTGFWTNVTGGIQPNESQDLQLNGSSILNTSIYGFADSLTDISSGGVGSQLISYNSDNHTFDCGDCTFQNWKVLDSSGSLLLQLTDMAGSIINAGADYNANNHKVTNVSLTNTSNLSVNDNVLTALNMSGNNINNIRYLEGRPINGASLIIQPEVATASNNTRQVIIQSTDKGSLGATNVNRMIFTSGATLPDIDVLTTLDMNGNLIKNFTFNNPQATGNLDMNNFNITNVSTILFGISNSISIDAITGDFRVIGGDLIMGNNDISGVNLMSATRNEAGFGSSSLNSFSFTGDSDTGLFHAFTNVLGFSAGGNNVVNMSVTDTNFLNNVTIGSSTHDFGNKNAILDIEGNVLVNGDVNITGAVDPTFIYVTQGNTSNPSFTKQSDNDTGLSLLGNGLWTLINNGIQLLTGSPTELNISQNTNVIGNLSVSDSLLVNGSPITPGGGGVNYWNETGTSLLPNASQDVDLNNQDLLSVNYSNMTSIIIGNSSGNITLNGSGVNYYGNARKIKSVQTYAYNMFGFGQTYNGVSCGSSTFNIYNTLTLVQDFNGAGACDAMILSFIMPKDYAAGSNYSINLHWVTTSATTNNINWYVGILATDMGEDWSLAETYYSNTSINAGANLKNEGNILNINGLNVLPGANVDLVVYRNPADALDTLNAIGKISSVELEYTADSLGA